MYPAIDALQANVVADAKEAFSKAVVAARSGADGTKNLIRKKGRGQYLGERALTHIDGGAEAVAIIFTSLDKALH